MENLVCRAEAITLRLRTPFRIAHGVSPVRHNVLFHLGEAVGLAALVPYYPYTQEDVLAYLEGIAPQALLGDDPLALEDALDRLPPGPPPARSAVDIACHDLWGRLMGQPLYRLWGLNPARAPYSSVTIGIPEDENDLRHQLKEKASYPILKLKLGTGDLERDAAIVRIASQERKQTSHGDHPGLCVDANSAWSLDEAVEMIPRLAAYDLLFIEQPIPFSPDDAQDWHRLRRRLPADVPPLIADESLHRPEDVLALAGAADGINIKLSKVGGIRPARRIITLARVLGMQVMLGCMVESAVGITAAAHMAPWVDFADLDGNLDVLNDPYVGVQMVDGRLHLPSGAGLGVEPVG